MRGKYDEWINDPDKLLLIEGWAKRGLSYKEIADNMGIALSTLQEWRKRYPVISVALKKGKEVVDIEVENALVKRALGYKTTEKVSELRIDKETGKQFMVVVKEIEKEVPPDTGALCFYLKNKLPEIWKDKQDISLDGVKQVVFNGEGDLLD